MFELSSSIASTYTTSGSCSTSARKRSSAARTRSSFRLRSPRSRMEAVKIGGPGSSSRVIASSTGNSSPLAFRAVTSIRLPSIEPVAVRRRSVGPAGEAAPMGVPARDGDDEPGELPPEDVLPPVAEELLRSPVELEHPPAVVDRHDHVEYGAEDGARVRLGETCRPVGGGRQGKDAGIGSVRRHAVRIVPAQAGGRPLVRGTPLAGLSPCPARAGAPGTARRPGSTPSR